MIVTNFERAILLTLYELREENLPSLLNTIKRDFSINLTHDEFELNAEESLKKFYELEFIEFAYKTGPLRKILTQDDLKTIFPLRNCLLWDIVSGMWRWNENELGTERVFVSLQPKAVSFIKNNIS